MENPTLTATREQRGSHAGAASLEQEMIKLDPIPILDPLNPKEIGPHFIIEGPSWRGGQAQVVCAREASNEHERYAIKLFGRNKEAACREWQTLQIHRNDATVPLCYSMGFIHGSEISGYGIVMEFIEGETLATLLSEPSFANTMTLEQALRIMDPVVRFCAKASRSRHLNTHGDIKPANIMVDTNGAVRLVDFGIAGSPSETAKMKGTYGFAAPEQWFQLPSADGSHSAVDTYGIAATFFSLFNHGKPPAYENGREHFIARFRHDDDLILRISDKVQNALVGKVSMEDRSLSMLSRRGTERSLERLDSKVSLRLNECLSFEQDKRPRADELESILPFDQEKYENELFSYAVIYALGMHNHQLGKKHFRHEDFQAELSADRSFIEALNEFNRGRYEKALPILRKRAESGDLSAMYYLGVCIRDNLGPLHPEEGPEAVAYYFSRAAEEGNILAQSAYGFMLLEGLGVDRNEREGRRWIEKSAADDPLAGKIGFSFAKKWLESNDKD